MVFANRFLMLPIQIAMLVQMAAFHDRLYMIWDYTITRGLWHKMSETWFASPFERIVAPLRTQFIRFIFPLSTLIPFIYKRLWLYCPTGMMWRRRPPFALVTTASRRWVWRRRPASAWQDLRALPACDGVDAAATPLLQRHHNLCQIANCIKRHEINYKQGKFGVKPLKIQSKFDTNRILGF